MLKNYLNEVDNRKRSETSPQRSDKMNQCCVQEFWFTVSTKYEKAVIFN